MEHISSELPVHWAPPLRSYLPLVSQTSLTIMIPHPDDHRILTRYTNRHRRPFHAITMKGFLSFEMTCFHKGQSYFGHDTIRNTKSLRCLRNDLFNELKKFGEFKRLTQEGN